MADLVCTVPRNLWWNWLDEGDVAGTPATGLVWDFYLGTNRPPIEPGERLYIVAWDRLRGYAPVTGVVRTPRGWAIQRRGGAVAVTIPETIRGFQGWRKVWWDRAAEVPFPDWKEVPQPPAKPRKRETHEQLVEKLRDNLSSVLGLSKAPRAQLGLFGDE